VVARADADVVDQDVEARERPVEGGEHRRDLARVAEVAAHGDAAPPERLDLPRRPGRPRLVDVADEKIGTRARQFERDGVPDPAPGPGDEGDAPAQVKPIDGHHPPSSRSPALAHRVSQTIGRST
jgi:hypothetical protein